MYLLLQLFIWNQQPLFFFFKRAAALTNKSLSWVALNSLGTKHAGSPPQYVLCTFTEHSSYTTRQPIDHCQTQRWPRFIKLRLRVHNKYTRTRRASQIGAGRASGKEQLKEKESQTPGSRAKETSRWLCLPDQDQVFLLKSFTLLPCKLCCGFKHRQTLPTTFPYGRPHLHASRSPRAPRTLAHFLRSEKWWHFSKVISNNLCVVCVCVPVCVWKQPYLLFRPNYF